MVYLKRSISGYLLNTGKPQNENHAKACHSEERSDEESLRQP